MIVFDETFPESELNGKLKEKLKLTNITFVHNDL